MQKISVIVPIYNVELYIEKCLQSLVDQTLRDIEIICVDDCGNDKSMDMVQQFAARDARIKIIHNACNSGLSKSRNNGIRAACAEYIMFCDSDDWFASDMCEKMYAAITAEGADLAICGTDVIYEADFDKRQSDEKYFAVNDTGTIPMAPWIQDIYSVCAWNKIYRRDIITAHDVYFPNGLKYEDNFYFYAYCPWVKKVAFVQDKLYKYRRRPGSIMNNTYREDRINLDPLKIAIAWWEYASQHKIISGRENWFWGTMFYGLFLNTLQYSSRVHHDKCYEMASEFVTRHYTGKNVDFYTRRKIQQILDRTLSPHRYLGGMLKITESAAKKDVRLCGFSLYKKKYFPTKTIYYIAGARTWQKSIKMTIETPRPLKQISLDDTALLRELGQLRHFTYIPNPGNIGDMLIAAATIKFFHRHNLKFSQFTSRRRMRRHIVYGGGGIWTADYRRSWIKILGLFERAEKIVILPSSFNNCPDLINVLDERFVVFCRERRSYEYMKSANTRAKIILDHDMAFRMESYTAPVRVSDDGAIVLDRVPWQLIGKTAYFMRQDRESCANYKTDLDVSNLSDGQTTSPREWIDFCAALMLNVVGHTDTIVTDRLHVAIAGLLANKQVYMLDNSYGKLSSVYEHSMKKYKNVHFCTEIPKL